MGQERGRLKPRLKGLRPRNPPARVGTALCTLDALLAHVCSLRRQASRPSQKAHRRGFSRKSSRLVFCKTAFTRRVTGGLSIRACP